MLNHTVILLCIALLFGCSSKEETLLLETYTKRASYNKQLQKTEKFQFDKKGVTQGMLTATYLKKSNPKEDEQFIVGIYGQKKVLLPLGKRLLLNQKHPISIQKLPSSHKLLNALPFASKWGDYYLVRFPYSKSKDLLLTLTTNGYGKGSLHFAKVAKYTLLKEPF